ncbi:MAG: segregation/condensation protein A [Candidatus Omnitrophota bacterium]|nr:segregation/condensation protein A [Candidatus Omnitrophota bacterium]
MINVKLPVYDGPLELLLDLIRKNEMDIYDIPIAEITRQYLETLGQMKQLDLEVAGEYLVLAATLIYIKSRMLLPQETIEEDDFEEDPRSELVRKLLEYQAFREAAKELGLLEGERGKVFSRQITDYYLPDIDPNELPQEAFTANLYDLISALQGILSRFSKVATHEVLEEIISIEEKINELRALLARDGRVVFSKLFRGYRTRNEVIATFLALLEVIRSGNVRTLQAERFGEIIIENKTTRQEVDQA